MSESVRDALTAAFDAHEASTTEATEAPAGTDPGGVVEATIPAAPAPAAADTPAKPGRTAGRPRDATGKLLPGKPVKAEVAPVADIVTGGTGTIAAPVVQPIPRPQSWKKEMWPLWDKLNNGAPLTVQEARQLVEYNSQREREYQSGVSTYKTEWDQVRPIAEAMAQFAPLLQQHNIQPAQWITNMGHAHKLLATGTPEQKLSAFAKLVDDYKIPVESLFVQGQDGRLYRNPNIQQHQPPQPAQGQQPDVRDLVRQTLLEERTASEIQSFSTATDSSGAPKYPHFEAVKPTMIGLLQAEIATDLPDAYQQALALPRHSDIAASIRAETEKADAAQKAAEQAKLVARAKTNAISARPSTPSVSGEAKPKGVRQAIESAWDTHVTGGRV